MKSITIKAKFTTKSNNQVRIDVYRANPDSYDFSKSFDGNFTEVLSDLQDATDYHIDFTGSTFGQVELSVSGDFVAPNPISVSFKKTSFKPGFIVATL